MWMETMSSRYRGLVPNLARHTHAGVPASVIPYFRNGYIMPFAAMHPERRLVLIRKLTATVASLHDNGVVHGFIYPMSILVDDHGYPLILPPANGDGHASSQMSGYMTLRALTGEDDVRTAADDVYALLCVVYEVCICLL
ncbi:hypothetical protein PLICRDRAFT_530513 [Plicaturopsis crispa FD-325 SS-3]|nr:hypothetical protein PLICRDRAFT_530513 [Plicaturopsis crispa FD-325 SS-3]